MTSPKYAADKGDGRGRTYPIPGYPDTEFISCTNILGALAKPALIGAASKHAGLRAMSNEGTWKAIQQEEGDDAARKYISRAFGDYGKYAASVGSAVHHGIEHLDEDNHGRYVYWHAQQRYQPDEEAFIKRVEAHIEQYRDFLKVTGAKVLVQERTVFHPLYDYAGTLDAVLDIGGRHYVTDWKTGFVAEEQVPLQLAAYRYATHYVDGDTTAVSDGLVDGGLVLALKPRSWKMYEVECGEAAFAAFLTCKQMWAWKDSGCKESLKEWTP
jgi:hypothetical protein